MLIGGIAFVAILGLIQLIPFRVTNPSARNEPKWDSPQTLALAKTACFDCHSNQTRSYWYEKIAPVSWWIKHHVDEGRARLNFDEWQPGTGAGGGRAARTIERGSMPPSFYHWFGLHSNAKLTPQQQQQLANGLEATLGPGGFDEGRRKGRTSGE
ncbi:MAG: heme-binding domain-containing protein [Acidimicrobiia bacterium]|nr:heme-binding domain-containing protein [Acidimicrobiia bacterium]